MIMKRFLLPAALFSISFAVAGAEKRQYIKVSSIVAYIAEAVTGKNVITRKFYK